MEQSKGSVAEAHLLACPPEEEGDGLADRGNDESQAEGPGGVHRHLTQVALLREGRGQGSGFRGSGFRGSGFRGSGFKGGAGGHGVKRIGEGKGGGGGGRRTWCGL